MTITNRSRLVVAVKNNETLRREFPFNKTQGARAYLEELWGEGYKSGRVEQLHDHILVRIRTTGYPELHKPLIEVVAADLEDWMRSRESDVILSTISRQYEMLRAASISPSTPGATRFGSTPPRACAASISRTSDRRLVHDELDHGGCAGAGRGKVSGAPRAGVDARSHG